MITKTLTPLEVDLLEMLKVSIALESPETAGSFRDILSFCCLHGDGDRKAIWNELDPQERSKFQNLVKDIPPRTIELQAPKVRSPLLDRILDGNQSALRISPVEILESALGKLPLQSPVGLAIIKQIEKVCPF